MSQRRKERRKKNRQQEEEEQTSPLPTLEGNNDSSGEGAAIESTNHFERKLETELVTTTHEPTKGTTVIAKKDIPAGITILEEVAFAWQPVEDYIGFTCHHCMAEVPRWAVGCGEGGGGCGAVGYCSPKCRERAAAVHRIEHKAFLQARDIALKAKADVALIKLATRIIALQSESEAKKIHFEKGVMGMVGHEDMFPKEWASSIADAAKLIMPLLPKEARLSTRDFVKICGRINTNSHRLHHLFMPQRILGVGLFPLASLINHSCKPNCGFYNRGPSLLIRTLRDVKEGEELVYSYIDLYQSRSKRQADLFHTKFFHCKCDQCAAPLLTSTDRFLCGFACPNRKCEGLLVLPSGDGSEVAPAADAVVTCSSAGCGQTKSAGDLLKAQKRAEIMLTTSQSLYYDQKRTSDSKTMLDKLLNGGYSPDLQLHPCHPTLFQAHVDSINVSDALGYTHTSLEHCSAVLRCAETVLPLNHLETSNYYYYQGMLYSELLAKHQTKLERREGAGKGLERASSESDGNGKEKEEDTAEDERKAKEAFTRCYAMRSVWFGADHQCAVKALDKLKAL